MPDTPTSSASSSMEPPVVRGLEKARAGSQVGQQTRRQAGSPGRTGRGRRTPTRSCHTTTARVLIVVPLPSKKDPAGAGAVVIHSFVTPVALRYAPP
jgi:hypothetical protein